MLNNLFGFTPREFWGIEFLDSSVRIAGVRKEGNELKLINTFQGTYEDAQKFAAQKFLGFKGTRAAFSTLPVKITRMEGIVNGSEEEVVSEENRLRPSGLNSEDISSRMFADGDEYILIQAGENAVSSMMNDLPPELSAVTVMTPSQIVLHRLCSGKVNYKHFAGLILENDYSHLLLYKNHMLRETVTIPFGRLHMDESLNVYIAELKKVLVYYWQSNLMESQLEAVCVFQTELEEYFESAGKDRFQDLGQELDIPFVYPEFSALEPAIMPVGKISSKFLTAAFLAASGANGKTILEDVSIAEKSSDIPEVRSLWLNRAGLLSKGSVITSIFFLVTVLLFLLTAGAFRLAHSAQSKGHAGEMAKLAEMKGQKKEIYERVKKIHGIVKERSRVTPDMAHIASALPENLWLSEFELRASESGKYVYNLSGYSYKESGVTGMLSRLEKDKYFSKVKLVSTEVIEGKKVRQLTKLKANNKDLILFKVSITQ